MTGGGQGLSAVKAALAPSRRRKPRPLPGKREEQAFEAARRPTDSKNPPILTFARQTPCQSRPPSVGQRVGDAEQGATSIILIGSRHQPSPSDEARSILADWDKLSEGERRRGVQHDFTTSCRRCGSGRTD